LSREEAHDTNLEVFSSSSASHAESDQTGCRNGRQFFPCGAQGRVVSHCRLLVDLVIVSIEADEFSSDAEKVQPAEFGAYRSATFPTRDDPICQIDQSTDIDVAMP
jgi:hypothetical protein